MLLMLLYSDDMSHVYVCGVFFFFFQAEDGIRDLTVTGVQTCALPISGEHDAAQKSYVLSVRQSCPPTPGQETKLPFHIPFAVGLVGPDGRDLLAEGTRVLSVKEPEERFVFENIAAKPVLSLLRNFSAPVIVTHDYIETELTHLMAHDRKSTRLNSSHSQISYAG